MEQLKFPVTKREAEKAGIEYSSVANKNAMFPSRLRALREEKGISQANLASLLGVSKSTIGLYETGDTLPDIETADKLCDCFGVSADYLLGRSPTKSQDIKTREVCAYTGLSEVAVNWLHDLLKLEPSKTCLPVLNALCEDDSFDDLLTYMGYAGKVIKEANVAAPCEFVDFEDYENALQEVKETLKRVGLSDCVIVDKFERAGYVEGVLQRQFMSTFEEVILKGDIPCDYE